MRGAIESAYDAKTPWTAILCRGGRAGISSAILHGSCPCARRQYCGNASEITALSRHMALGGRGVDTTEAALAALPAAQALARQIDCIVVVTGGRLRH